MNPSEGSRVVVFAHGANMLVARMRERAPLSKAVSVGQLVGFELCWNKRSRDGSGKCSVTETGHPKHVVWGVTYEMGASDKSSLDRAEGLGQGYGERAVNIHTQAGRLSALTYYATSIDPGIRPYDWYRDLVIAGAREHGLPEEYVRILEKVATVMDSDADRAATNHRLLTTRLKA
jgi:gamma-glutamylcyclotransferase